MDPEPIDAELDALLRRARPQPEGAWVRTTGEQLFAGQTGRRSRPALKLGTVFAGGLAAFATALSLAGVGPLATGDQTVDAQDNCRTVTVTKLQRVPSIMTTPSGEVRVTYTRRPVEISERRCG